MTLGGATVCAGLVPGIKGGQVADAGPALRGWTFQWGPRCRGHVKRSSTGKTKGMLLDRCLREASVNLSSAGGSQKQEVAADSWLGREDPGELSVEHMT